MLHRVYVDEAGDRGISANSDRHFVVSAIIVADSADAQLRGELAELRVALGRHPGHTLHFVKFSHSQRLKAVQDIAGFSLAAITNVIAIRTSLASRFRRGIWLIFPSPTPCTYGHSVCCWSESPGL